MATQTMEQTEMISDEDRRALQKIGVPADLEHARVLWGLRRPGGGRAKAPEIRAAAAAMNVDWHSLRNAI